MCVYMKSDMNFATFGILYWRVPFFNVQPALVYFIWLFGLFSLLPSLFCGHMVCLQGGVSSLYSRCLEKDTDNKNMYAQRKFKKPGSGLYVVSKLLSFTRVTHTYSSYLETMSADTKKDSFLCQSTVISSSILTMSYLDFQ